MARPPPAVPTPLHHTVYLQGHVVLINLRSVHAGLTKERNGFLLQDLGLNLVNVTDVFMVPCPQLLCIGFAAAEPSRLPWPSSWWRPLGRWGRRPGLLLVHSFLHDMYFMCVLYPYLYLFIKYSLQSRCVFLLILYLFFSRIIAYTLALCCHLYSHSSSMWFCMYTLIHWLVSTSVDNVIWSCASWLYVCAS